MSDTKIGHKIHEAAKPAAPKPADKPAGPDAAPRPVAAPKETVALSHPEAEGGENTAHHDALKDNFGAKDDKAAGPNGETPRTPQQQRADIVSDIKDIQGEIKATKDPAEKKALEEELAALQGQLQGLDPQGQGNDGEGTPEAAGPAAVGGAAPVTSNGGPRIQTPWVHQQSTRGGPGEGGRQVGSPSGPAPAANPSGDVKEWVQQAMQILQQEGVDMSKVREQDIYTMIQKESSGNPHAQNNWDSNAKKGTPSKGIMQTIDSTFNQFKAPGHGDIWNPVDNIVAAVKYSISRYGSTSNVPGIKSMGQGGAYKGY